MEHIASAQNSRIKHLAKLAASAAKRRAFGQTLLEGTHLLEAFLNAGGRPECVYVAENRLEDAEISALLQRMPSEKTVSVAAPILGRLTGLGEGGNIVALIKLPSAAKRPEDGDCVVLERVQDPGNIGTILRSAAAAGVRDIVLSADCADVWSPKVLRAAMGAHFLLTLHPDTDLAVWRQGYRPPLLATALDERACGLYGLDLRDPCGWLFGNEGAGVSAEMRRVADRTVKIPMAGNTESLNVAMAATVCLFEQMRQRLPAAE